MENALRYITITKNHSYDGANKLPKAPSGHISVFGVHHLI